MISTIFDKCKRCYSCIRECPAKAIQVVNGQAAVIPERCIACGHCIKVCSQHAKFVLSDSGKVTGEILNHPYPAAIVAPSFAASFPDNYTKLPAALKALGFKRVVETAFGADLISGSYLDEFRKDDTRTIISTSCPAVYAYVEKYHRQLMPNLAKIVSPMIAAARFLRNEAGQDIKIVFIGPCIAKKKEYIDTEVAGAVDAVLTFAEIKNLFKQNDIVPDLLETVDFDPPHAYTGKSFPLAGGLLKTAGISGDILEKELIVVEGKQKVIELIDELADNKINAKFVDVLFCEGCISGPAIDSNLNYYSRREAVIKYIEQKIHTVDKQVWKSNLYNSRNLDLTRTFSGKNQRRPMPPESIIKEILAETNKFDISDELNCGACGYATCREFAIAQAKGLAEKDMCLPHDIDRLAKAYDDLKNAQEQLRTAEKLASIGQLAAGVAHEINNPLGTILLYSSMLRQEITEHQGFGQTAEDLSLIIEEANRCKNIVTNLLNFARQGKLKLGRININRLLTGIVKVIKANPLNSPVNIHMELGTEIFTIDGDEDQLKQVFLNILNNACEALEESSVKNIEIKLYYEGSNLITEIKDSGIGISEENFNKIFTPFFTTKKIGKGTGLGLAITYGIIKMHKGNITFRSSPGNGSVFTVKLPVMQGLNN